MTLFILYLCAELLADPERPLFGDGIVFSWSSEIANMDEHSRDQSLIFLIFYDGLIDFCLLGEFEFHELDEIEMAFHIGVEDVGDGEFPDYPELLVAEIRQDVRFIPAEDLEHSGNMMVFQDGVIVVSECKFRLLGQLETIGTPGVIDVMTEC